MYATCLFCHHALGANEVIERFPVGRRLAYDAAKGRLWVVCARCGRWNLSPLEERWEAIEEAERLYRDTKKRVATDNIGLARLRDGTDLIRIGAPLLPEFAAWRYGSIFSDRRMKTIRDFMLITTASGIVGRMGGSAFSLAALGAFAAQMGVVLGVGMWRSSRLKVAVKDDEGRMRTLTQSEAWTSRFAHDRETGGLKVLVASRHGAEYSSMLQRSYQRVRSLSTFAFDERYAIELKGPNALRALSNMLPAVNVMGGTEKQVSEATELVQRINSPGQLFHELASGRHKARWQMPNAPPMISKVTPGIRLALEMSLHEADERRAMEGDLHELEQRWKEAEAIASIADNLTLGPATEQRLAKLRQRVSCDDKGG